MIGQRRPTARLSRHRPTGLALAVAIVLAGCGPKPAPPAPAPSNRPVTPPPTVVAPTDGFAATATAGGFVYAPPLGFTAAAVTDNADVSYDHALASADGHIELRYSLRPYPPELDPAMRTRQFSSTFFLTAILNLTRGGTTGEAGLAQSLPAEEFGADQATMTIVHWFKPDGPADAFGTGYEVAAVLYLHRDGFGDAYVFTMLRNLDALDQLPKDAVHSLRFAPR